MNSDKHKPRNVSGNVLIYILLALALLGGLTMVIAKQNDQAGGQDLSAEKAELLALKMVAYAGSTKNTIDQMMMSGTQINRLDFTRPGAATFDTAPYIHKVYHPSGGGLTYESASTEAFEGLSETPPAGWYLSRPNNVEWTPTTATDVLLVAYRINKNICESINVKITGSKTIPALPSGMPAVLLSAADGGGGDSLNAVSCAACKGYPSLCVSNNTGLNFSYYSIISGQ